jgi:hypothetical protein
MIESTNQTHLSQEPWQRLLPREVFSCYELDCDQPAHEEMTGLVDATHSSLCKQFKNDVSVDSQGVRLSVEQAAGLELCQQAFPDQRCCQVDSVSGKAAAGDLSRNPVELSRP